MLEKYPTPIVAVYAEHLDRNTLLGYAMGDHDDIAAYFESRKAYGLKMEEVVPILIPKGYASKREGLVEQKEALEAGLARTEAQIKSP